MLMLHGVVVTAFGRTQTRKEKSGNREGRVASTDAKCQFIAHNMYSIISWALLRIYYS